MLQVKRFLGMLALIAFCSPLIPRAYADTVVYSGNFAADNSSFVLPFSTAITQNYTFTTTSYAAGGFAPVLTLFRAGGGNPLAFAETDISDVSLMQLLGPGSYLLYLTESPNVFTTDLASGTLFAGSPTITGDLCGVSGGKFLNIVDCSQRSSGFSLSATNVVPTPEPGTLLLLLSPAAALAISQRRRLRS